MAVKLPFLAAMCNGACWSTLFFKLRPAQFSINNFATSTLPAIYKSEVSWKQKKIECHFKIPLAAAKCKAVSKLALRRLTFNIPFVGLYASVSLASSTYKNIIINNWRMDSFDLFTFDYRFIIAVNSVDCRISKCNIICWK